MKKDDDLYNCGSSEHDDVIFRNVNNNPHTPIDPKTGEVLLEDNKKHLIEFVEKIRKGQRTAKRFIVTTVSTREKKEIERLTGETLNANIHTIGATNIFHIENRHGENGLADSSMKSLDNYGKIVDVLHDFQKVDFLYDSHGNIKTSKEYADKNNKPAKMIIYTKEFKDNTYFVVEAVTDGKSGDIKIVSAYNKPK